MFTLWRWVFDLNVYAAKVKLIIIINNWSPQCKAGREWEHSISPKTSPPHNQQIEERKR